MSKCCLPCFRTFTTKRITSVDLQEMKNFNEMAKEWWDEKGALRALHSLNDCRIPWIQKRLSEIGATGRNVNKSAPLEGLSILDVGCGGGIMSEALSRLGCETTGLDPNDTLIKIAKQHAKTETLSNLTYECSTIQEHSAANTEKYDVVLCSETIEHVSEKEEFVKFCIQCLKPGGSIFLTTHNKTWISGFYIIFLGENLFKFAPRGTHEFDKFIGICDLCEMLRKRDCETVFKSGMVYRPWKNEWKLISNYLFSYVVHGIKNK